MLVKIQHMVTLETFDIKYVSKAILVRNFKKLVKEITRVDVKHQNLYFCGKLLTVIVTVGTVIGCSAKTKFCQMAPKSTENH